MLGLGLAYAFRPTALASRTAQDVAAGQGAHRRLPEVEPAAGLAFTLKPFQKQGLGCGPALFAIPGGCRAGASRRRTGPGEVKVCGLLNWQLFPAWEAARLRRRASCAAGGALSQPEHATEAPGREHGEFAARRLGRQSVCGAARQPAMPPRRARAGRPVRLTLGARRLPGGWRAGRRTRRACAAASWRTSRAPARPCRSSRSSGPTRRPRPSSACAPPGAHHSPSRAHCVTWRAPMCSPCCTRCLRARPARRLAARAAGSARVLHPIHRGADAAGRRAGRGGGRAAI